MIFRHSRVRISAAALMFAVATAVVANPDASAQREIDHLLAFVAGASSCTFARNGTDYAAQKAAEHLAGKLRFAASRIATAEDFIRDVASRSSVSGEGYRVKCGNVDMPAGEWLTEELRRHRESRVRTAG
jgi:hypothetical protein